MSDELRNRLRQQADEVSVPSDDLRDVISGGRSLKWRRRLYSGGAAVLVALLVWTTVPELLSADGEDKPPPVVGTPTPKVNTGRCNDVPFRATDLPDGWSYRLQPGSGGYPGKHSDVTPPDRLAYWAPVKKPLGEYIDVLKGKSPYVPTSARSIPVLGDEGRIGVIEDGWSVEFSYRGCDYVVMTFSESRGILGRVARTLRPTDTCTGSPVFSERLLMEDGRHFGYVRAMRGRQFEFDPAEMLSGDAANEAAVAAGVIEEGDTVPNDYFIDNKDKRVTLVPIAKDPKVVIETSSMDAMVGPAPADIQWLACAFTGSEPLDEVHQRSPYWITIEDGSAIEFEEQYLP